MERYAQTPSEIKMALLFKIKRDYPARRAELEPFIDHISREYCGIGSTAEQAIDNAISALQTIATSSAGAQPVGLRQAQLHTLIGPHRAAANAVAVA